MTLISEFPCSYLPIISLVVFMLGFSLGFGGLPFLLLGELFPAQYRSQLSAMASAVNLMSMFSVIKSYHALDVSIPTTLLFIYLCSYITYQKLTHYEKKVGKKEVFIFCVISCSRPATGNIKMIHSHSVFNFCLYVYCCHYIVSTYTIFFVQLSDQFRPFNSNVSTFWGSTTAS